MRNVRCVVEVEESVAKMAYDYYEVDNRLLDVQIVALLRDGQQECVGRIFWEEKGASDVSAAAREAWAEAPGPGSGPTVSPGYALQVVLSDDQVQAAAQGIVVSWAGGCRELPCDLAENTVHVAACEAAGVCLQISVNQHEVLNEQIVHSVAGEYDADMLEQQYRSYHTSEQQQSADTVADGVEGDDEVPF